ncbi:MAG: hypothetical protein HYT76_01540 [Deltaproteobacteria bacterium]|nr:hypothetical protein [Deltaproteobacteria bacterium]
MNRAQFGIALGVAAFTTACGLLSDDDNQYQPGPSGGVTPPTGSNPPPDAGADHGIDQPDAGVSEETTPTSLGVIGSDFVNGDAWSLNLASFAATRINLSVHNDAAIRIFDRKLWFWNRVPRDSFQCYDPEKEVICSPEISVEAGANLQDGVVKDGFAYVSQYETGEVVKYDIMTGLPVDWHDLVRFTINDGDRRPRPSPLLEIGLYVIIGVQDLPTDLLNSANYTAPAKLVVLNTETGELQDEAIELPCSNVVALAYRQDDDTLYASCAGTYDTTDTRGGIVSFNYGEMMASIMASSSPEERRRLIRMINDETLGGTPGPLAVGGGYVFTTAGFTPPSVVRVGADLLGEAVAIFGSNGYWIPMVRWIEATDPTNSRLAIADQDPETPGIWLSSADGEDQDGPYLLEGGLAPIDAVPYR